MSEAEDRLNEALRRTSELLEGLNPEGTTPSKEPEVQGYTATGLQYNTVTAGSIRQLCIEANTAGLEGWVPIGGPMYLPPLNGRYEGFVQAFVRKKKT